MEYRKWSWEATKTSFSQTQARAELRTESPVLNFQKISPVFKSRQYTKWS